MNRNRIVVCLLALLALVSLVGCTANNRARTFGGTETVTLPAGRVLVNATWKEADLWILTRPRREGEKPEVYEFSEKSQFGVLQGTVIIKEQ